MWKNHILTTFRALRRQVGYSTINIFGLAVGLACCVMILLYVQDELSYDRFYPDSDRLYRVAVERSYPGRTSSYAVIPMPVARTLQQDYPEVEGATRVTTAMPTAVRFEDRIFQERNIYYADSTFFDLFGIEPIAGEPGRLLSEPNSIVVTPQTAQKYFGDSDPLGKQLTIDGRDYTVSGVVPSMPDNSHFHFDFVVSLNLPWLDEGDWLELATTQYIRLSEGANPDLLEAKLPDMVQRYAGEQLQTEMGITLREFQEAGNGYRYFLQAVPDIHLYSQLEYELEPNSNITYIYLLSVVALIILLIAGVNYINLSTAQGLNRAREVGVRKVLGSERKQLIRQFLTESVLISFLSLLAAVLMSMMLLPLFNELTGKVLTTGVFAQWWLIGSLCLMTLSVGLLAGCYPAFFLSAFRPTEILKGKLAGSTRGSGLRNGLVVFQFALTITLLIGVGVVRDQMQFVSSTNLGFEKEQLLVIERAGILDDRQHLFMQELGDHPAILESSRSNGIPGYNFSGLTLIPADPTGPAFTARFVYADDTFLDTYGMELAEGRNFIRDRTEDAQAILVNETFAEEIGWEDPVGRQVTIPGDRRGGDVRFTVVGVVQDFHHESLHLPIGPVVIRHDQGPRFPLLSVRIAGGDPSPALRHIERTWQEFAADQPINYYFFDQHYDALYASEARTAKVFGSFTVLSILLACMGLFGLSAYTIVQRKKEIGIRKVLGASVAGILVLLTRNYLKLILIAFMIAVPVSFLAMNRWLQGFAYHTQPDLMLFLLAGVLAAGVALLAVSSLAVRASLANPVESLSSE